MSTFCSTRRDSLCIHLLWIPLHNLPRAFRISELTFRLPYTLSIRKCPSFTTVRLRLKMQNYIQLAFLLFPYSNAPWSYSTYLLTYLLNATHGVVYRSFLRTVYIFNAGITSVHHIPMLLVIIPDVSWKLPPLAEDFQLGPSGCCCCLGFKAMQRSRWWCRHLIGLDAIQRSNRWKLDPRQCALNTSWSVSCAIILALTSCAGGQHNMSPPLQVDLWPFDLESGIRVTCDVGYLCANFSIHRPLDCSRLNSDLRDRQTSYTHYRLMPPPYGGGA